jgi:hypothetical protein
MVPKIRMEEFPKMRFLLCLLPLAGLILALRIPVMAQEQPERVELGPVEVEDASSVDLLKPLLPKSTKHDAASLSPKAPTIDPMLRPIPIGPRHPALTKPSPLHIAPTYLKSATHPYQYKPDALAAKVPTGVTSGTLIDSDLETFRDLTQRRGYFVNRGGNLRYYTPSGNHEDSLNAVRFKRSNYDRISPTRGEKQSLRDKRSLRMREGRMYRNRSTYR